MQQTQITAKIDNFSHDCRGICRIDGKTTFVNNSLPGEEVVLRYTKRRPQFDEANAETILIESDSRVTAKCPHFNLCGGCKIQYIDDAAQIHFKQQAIIEQMQRLGNVTADEVLPPLRGKSWKYRRRARLGVKYVIKKGKVLVGFRERQSRYLADLNQCDILHPAIGEKIPALSELIHGLSCYNRIPQIEATVADNTCAMVLRHLEPFTEKDLQQIREFAKKHQIQFYLQPKGIDSIECIYPEQAQELYYRLEKFNIECQFKPSDFIQVNAKINQKLIALTIELLDLKPTDKVLDLFCGIGNFSLPIATQCAHVYGVEGEKQLVAQATHNATHNVIKNASFYQHDLNLNTEQAPWHTKDIQKILIDPARSGAQKIVSEFPFDNIKRIVYVSCNPATLARDAGILVYQRGFKLSKLGAIDMFPHTNHVESIAVFDK